MARARSSASEAAALQLHTLTLKNRTHEYDNVSTWHFQKVDDVQYAAGMYLHLMQPGSTKPSKEIVRHMSFASAPHEDVISISMDTSSNTAFKKAMAAMEPGDTVKAFKIQFKHFEPAWPSKDDCSTGGSNRADVVFLAGGIGITPVRSLIMAHATSIDWRLVHVSRHGKYLYGEELSRTFASGAQVRTDHAGAAAAVATAVAELPSAWFYICGSERFADGMTNLLAKAGVDDGKIRVESFGSSTPNANL